MVVHARRVQYLIAFMLIVALFISGCAPRVGAGILAESAPSDETIVDLPALVIEYDASGEASLFGVPVSTMGEMLGTDLSALNLFSEERIQGFMDKNIQHIVINNQPNGLRFYVNGKNLPGLVWDAESLDALIATMEDFGTDVGPAGSVLPLLPNLGAGVVLQMPLAPGQAAIPVTPPNVGELSAQAAQDQFQQAKNTAIRAPVSLSFDAEGNLTVEQLPPALSFFPIPWDQISLDAETIESLTSQGIESLSITTVPGGLLLAINGNTLPYIQFTGEGAFANLLELITGLSSDEGGAMAQLQGILPILQSLLNVAGVQLSIQFPPAAE